VHSFTPIYEGIPRSLEIGILVSHPHQSMEFAQYFLKEILVKNYKAELDEPYDGKSGTPGIDTLLRAHDPLQIIGFEIEIRNDIIRDSNILSKIAEDFTSIFIKLCDHPRQ